MNTAPAIPSRLSTPSPSTSAVSVATRDLHLAFGRNKVLRGVDLGVPAGTAACIIGPSGSGKSTLLRCVNRLLEPDSGEVFIAGRSVMGDDPDVLRQRIGMVFQHFNLFPHKSVLANITLGLRKLRGLSREEAEAAALTQLDRVDLRHKAHVRPRHPLGRSAAEGGHRTSSRPVTGGHALRRGHLSPGS